jgi:hypothetical protein
MLSYTAQAENLPAALIHMQNEWTVNVDRTHHRASAAPTSMGHLWAISFPHPAT